MFKTLFQEGRKIGSGELYKYIVLNLDLVKGQTVFSVSHNSQYILWDQRNCTFKTKIIPQAYVHKSFNSSYIQSDPKGGR